MITRPTTFVVGAGASNDYGLPTSVELRQEAHKLNPEDRAYQLILAAGLCTQQQLNNVLNDLRSQGTSSIDEFLFARQDDEITMKVGRALIALLLGSHFPDVRSPDSLVTEQSDWLGYIIDKMQSGARDCQAFFQGNEEVRFVTFNFDSIIEDRLEKALRNLYRGTADAHLQNVVNAIHRQIIHVHGQLTPPPSQLPPIHQLGYGSGWIDWLRSAPSEIRVVMDQIERSTLVATQLAVRRSKILCFLGFAYANDNLERLHLPKSERLNYGQIYGTAFGMRPGETVLVSDKLRYADLGGESEGCFYFLRNHRIFTD